MEALEEETLLEVLVLQTLVVEEEVASLVEVVVLVVCKLELCYSLMDQHIQYQLEVVEVVKILSVVMLQVVQVVQVVVVLVVQDRKSVV